MAKTIKGMYMVCDCEHWGDVERDERYLRNNGCTVVSHYWDGHDCGEAYIEFTCKEQDFPALYKRFGMSASFKANINDYVKGEGLQGYKRMPCKELFAMKKQMDNDLSAGFENRLALHLWFEVRNYRDYTTEQIVERCLSYLKDVEVIGYDTKIVDGNEFIDILLRSSYENLTNERIKAVGDYCLGDGGFLGMNHIYGACECNHVFLNRSKMWYYGLLQDIVKRIHNREDLEYRGGSYYHPVDKTMTAADYMAADGTLRAEIIEGSITYRLKDPRFWNC